MVRLEQIFQEMADFVKWTGAAVLPADNPSSTPPSIGFVAFYTRGDLEISQRWEMPARQACEDLKSMGFAKDMIVTASDRRNFAALVPGQNSFGRLPTFECPKCGSRTWVPGFSADQHPDAECRERLVVAIMEM